MPITNDINDEEKIIYTTCTGIMEECDFDHYIKTIWNDFRHYGYNELFDTVRADWSDFDFGYLLSLAENAARLKTIDPETRLAWVVLEGKQRELTDFYKAAKAMLPVKSRTLEAFFSRDEALRWLKG